MPSCVEARPDGILQSVPCQQAPWLPNCIGIQLFDGCHNILDKVGRIKAQYAIDQAHMEGHFGRDRVGRVGEFGCNGLAYSLGQRIRPVLGAKEVHRFVARVQHDVAVGIDNVSGNRCHDTPCAAVAFAWH